MDTKQLKQKILDLAIRGKLVPQDPNDEPASVLLERIRKEKEQLIAAGKLKKSKSKTTDTPHYENVPFEIPDSWEWTRLDIVCDKIVDGDHNPPKGLDEPTEYLMVSSRNINHNRIENLDNVRYLSKDIFEIENQRTKLNKGDILFTSVGSLGRSCIYNGDLNLCFQRSVSIIHTLVYNYWLKYFFDSDYYQNIVVEKSTGTAQVGFYLQQLSESIVAIPPLAEQKMIVAEIEKWFALIDEIEQNKVDLRDYIKQTKSKVLDLAIHGKLVPQDPNDEPAIDLLKRINPSFKPCDTSHYENLPNGWTICSLSDIAKITAGGTPSRKIISYWDGGTIPWLKIADMTTSGKYVRSASEYITEEGMKNSSAKLMKKGTLLYTIFASIGEVAILDFEATCNQAIANIDLYMPEMTDYIYYYLKNLQAYMYSISKGCTQQNINQSIMKAAIVPVPPLAEQKRIVERIETIFVQLDTITAEL